MENINAIFCNMDLSQPHDKIEVMKVLEARTQNLQEELNRARQLRASLEAEKMFWKQREEEFRAQCFQIKK